MAIDYYLFINFLHKRKEKLTNHIPRQPSSSHLFAPTPPYRHIIRRRQHYSILAEPSCQGSFGRQTKMQLISLQRISLALSNCHGNAYSVIGDQQNRPLVARHRGDRS
jgi:hypothetical protein